MKLIVYKNGELISEKTLNPSRFEVLGRSSSNSVVLKDPRISREHAKLYFEGGRWHILDMGSQNGILLNRREVKNEPLIPGEEYDIGPFIVKILEATNAEVSVDNTDAFLNAIAVKPGARETVTVHKPTSPKSSSHSLKKIHEVERDELGLDEDDTVPPQESNARLVVMSGEKSGEEIKVNEAEVVIGSGKDSQVFFGTNAAGTQKATIVSPRDGTFIIRAENSFPEVRIDGVPIKERELENHDRIEIGDSRLEFVTGQSRVQSRKTGVKPRPGTIKPKGGVFNAIATMDWRTLMVAGLFVGSILTFVLTQGIIKNNKPNVTQTTRDDEIKRLKLLHLAGAQDLIREGKLDEAEEKVKFILQSIDPANADARKLAHQIQVLKKKKLKEEASQEEQEKKKKLAVRALVEDGDELLEAGKFDAAQATYQKALDLSPENPLALAAIEHLKTVQEETDREVLAKKKSDETLEKIYNQGIDEFEKGNKTDAKKLLSEILKYPSHKRYTSAKRMIEKLGGTIPEPAEDSTEDTPLEVSPEKEKAAEEDNVSNEVKAKEAYRKGLTFLEITNDPAQALDQFELVLKLVPDPNNDYHVKAKRKIKQLQLEP